MGGFPFGSVSGILSKFVMGEENGAWVGYVVLALIFWELF